MRITLPYQPISVYAHKSVSLNHWLHQYIIRHFFYLLEYRRNIAYFRFPTKAFGNDRIYKPRSQLTQHHLLQFLQNQRFMDVAFDAEAGGFVDGFFVFRAGHHHHLNRIIFFPKLF